MTMASWMMIYLGMTSTSMMKWGAVPLEIMEQKAFHLIGMMFAKSDHGEAETVETGSVGATQFASFLQVLF